MFFFIVPNDQKAIDKINCFFKCNEILRMHSLKNHSCKNGKLANTFATKVNLKANNFKNHSEKCLFDF